MEAAGLAYRAAGDSDRDVVLFVHGYPESSYMWRHALEGVAAAGWHGVAPDLAGYGDSEPIRPGTWERHVESFGRFVDELGLPPVVLVTHDWGVPVGLTWACEHRESVRALVISDGGFFSDRRWHDVANVMRTPDEGEKLIGSYTRELFGQFLGAASSGMTDDALDEYWKAFADDSRRMAQLELYRSGDFEKFAPYEAIPGQMGVPALVMWGEQDRFAGVKMAHRFHDEIPGSELALFEDAGHFVWEDEPEGATRRLVEFLGRA
jgi:haloalkane dehalogenase